MRIETIRQMVQAAVEHERQTGQMVHQLVKVCAMRRNPIAAQTARLLANYSIVYVSLVPQYLEEGMQASYKIGINKEMSFMLHELEAYWFMQLDLIPDYLGLAGIMDDAYASLHLLQCLSQHCGEFYDHILLNDDLSVSNAFARDLLGDTIAAALEKKVQLTLNANLADRQVNHILETIAHSGFTFHNPLASCTEQETIRREARLYLGNRGMFK